MMCAKMDASFYHRECAAANMYQSNISVLIFQDDSGTIEMAELVEIIGTLYEMEVPGQNR